MNGQKDYRELVRLTESGVVDTLKAEFSQFNLFEAIGMERQEVRHSYLLTYLLDPDKPHGLGSRFLMAFLRKVAELAPDGSLPDELDDLAEWAVQRVSARREVDYVDILVKIVATAGEEERKLVVLIENKIDSEEHGGQLERYLRGVKGSHRESTTLPIYLTPSGKRASLDDFVPVDYTAVCGALQQVLGEPSELRDDVRVVLEHYGRMLRMQIVSETDIAKRCREIYRQHKHAIDLISKHMRDTDARLLDLLVKLVEGTGEFRVLGRNKQYVTFYPTEWDSPPCIRADAEWSRSKGRVMAFQFENTDGELTLRLWIALCPDQARGKEIVEVARDWGEPFIVAVKPLPGGRFWSIYERRFASSDAHELEFDELERLVQSEWPEFLSDWAKMAGVLRGEPRLWQANATP